MATTTKEKILSKLRFTSYDVTYCERENGYHFWKVERKERGEVISVFECETMMEAKRIMNRSQAAMIPKDGGVVALISWYDGGNAIAAKMIRHMEKVEA